MLTSLKAQAEKLVARKTEESDRIDEPLIVEQDVENKDPITFHPQAVKETLATLNNLSQDDLELINMFVQKYNQQDEERKMDLFATFEMDIEETGAKPEEENEEIEETGSEYETSNDNEPESESYTTSQELNVPNSQISEDGDRSCENLLPPENGFLQYSDGLRPGSVVTYSCVAGYEIRQRGPVRKVRTILCFLIICD